MLALQGVTPTDIARTFELELAEARKIHAALQRGEGVDQPIAGVRRDSLERIRARAHVPALEVERREASRLDPFVKYVFRAADGELFETVRIPLEKPGRFTVCVSSQVGCAMGCRFCATGRLGLRRNLEAWEIVEQVRVVRAELQTGRIHGVVFQGMGEPLANLDRVLQAIAVFNEPSGLAIDARNITVCTSGLPTPIRKLARLAPKVRLGLSIGSVAQERRRSLMPIADAHPWEEVLDAAVEHAQATGLAPLWAVTPLRGFNASFDDGQRLGESARGFWERTQIRPRISVIPYNSIGGEDPFERPSETELAEFERGIRASGYPSHRRYSGGSDVSAACGQLAAQATERAGF